MVPICVAATHCYRQSMSCALKGGSGAKPVQLLEMTAGRQTAQTFKIYTAPDIAGQYDGLKGICDNARLDVSMISPDGFLQLYLPEPSAPHPQCSPSPCLLTLALTTAQLGSLHNRMTHHIGKSKM